ncbi:unnamed protein product [Moneuplotes crassus]|uniref:Uncharacterized protein n=1 Tax=Euplotes crassus TaxID=5936 RepID=A0AAD1YBH8_EUPCR|nr:unnamed protein product [Moneuplotes crassus]
MIFVRLINHREIADMSHWKEVDSCFICDRSHYTVIRFESILEYLEELPKTVNKAEEALIMRYVKHHNPLFYELEVGNLEENTTYICGTHTDWKIKKMHDFDNLSQLLRNDEDSEDSDQEIIQPQQTLLAYRHEMDHNICGYNKLRDESSYKIHHVPDLGRRAHLIETELTFCQASFITPGMHACVIFYTTLEKKFKEIFYKFHVPIRKEDIQIRKRKLKVVEKYRKFDKNTSVFKEWKEDNPTIITKTLINDIKYWKVPNMIRDKKEYEGVIQVLLKYLPKLKHIYIDLISSSEYPLISRFDFFKYAEQIGIIDEKLPGPELGTLFVATNYEIEKREDLNSKLELCRYEFYEILVRIANDRYKKHGDVATYAEALEHLIQHNILPYSFPKPWKEFRDKILWTLEVNDIFQVNIDSLREINNKMSLEKCIDLMTNKINSGLNLFQVTHCFGMSRMTIMDEMRKPVSIHLKLTEFLEFIGRCANLMEFNKENSDSESEKEEELKEEAPVTFLDKLHRLLKLILMAHHKELKEPIEDEFYEYESEFISNDNISDFNYKP